MGEVSCRTCSNQHGSSSFSADRATVGEGRDGQGWRPTQQPKDVHLGVGPQRVVPQQGSDPDT